MCFHYCFTFSLKLLLYCSIRGYHADLRTKPNLLIRFAKFRKDLAPIVGSCVMFVYKQHLYYRVIRFASVCLCVSVFTCLGFLLVWFSFFTDASFSLFYLLLSTMTFVGSLSHFFSFFTACSRWLSQISRNRKRKSTNYLAL